MSKTAIQQPQEEMAKGTSWLAQLRVNAQYAGRDPNALAAERFQKPLGALTLAEAQTLVWDLNRISNEKAEAEKAARVPVNGDHSHPCIACSGAVECWRMDCRETASEHRYCREGISRGQYERRMQREWGW